MPFIMQLSHSSYQRDVLSVEFEIENGAVIMTLDSEDGIFRVLIGITKPAYNELEFANEKYIVYAQAELKYNEDDVPVMVAEFNFVETPHTRTVKFFLNETYIDVVFSELPSVWPALEKIDFTKHFQHIGGEFIEYKLKRVLVPNAKGVEEMI